MKRFFKSILVLALLFIGLNFAYQKTAPEIEKTFGTRNPLPYLTAKVQQFISPEKFKMMIQMPTVPKAILLKLTLHLFILTSLIPPSGKPQLMESIFGTIQGPLISKLRMTKIMPKSSLKQ